MDRRALRADERQHRRWIAFLLRQVKADHVDVEDHPLAQPGTVQHELARLDLGLVIDLDSRDFGRRRVERRYGHHRTEK